MDSGHVVSWFDLPAGRSPSALLRSLRRVGYGAGPPTVFREECLFLETQDGRLARGGCRLSIRRTGQSAAWHLSGPEGERQDPFEGAFPFRSLSPDTVGVPPPATELAGGRLLLPLVRLRSLVSDTRVQSPSGTVLAFRAERVIAAPPRGGWPKGARSVGLLTVRLVEGDADTFLRTITDLRDRLGLSAAAGDTCRVALLALNLPEPGAPLPDHLRMRSDDTMAVAARKVIGQQAVKMRANIAGTIEGEDPEYLHDLRVATRRLRSALRLFAGVLGSRRSDALRRDLGWVAQRLGAVRDLDVFILNLREQAQRLTEADAIAALLTAELARRRQPARVALKAALTSRRFQALMRRLDALASSPPPRPHPGAHTLPVAEMGPVLLEKAQRRVLRLGRTVGPTAPAADLHRLRILCKRLRYACEFFREAFGDPASGADPLADYIRTMVRFQDCLGEHQDAVTAIGRIQDLAKEMVQHEQVGPEALLQLGGLIQVQRDIARKRRGRLVKLWARFDRRSVRKQLGALKATPPTPGRGDATAG
jgi:CHAD domain-containing protein